MPWLPANTFATAVHDTSAVLCFRALPIASWALAAPRSTARLRLLGATLCLLLAGAAVAWKLVPLGNIALTYGYFVAAGSTLPLLAAALRKGYASSGAAFALCGFVFFILPGLYAPIVSKFATMIIAWDLLLSSYSYCIETSKTDRTPNTLAARISVFEDCLFFLLVNPALVYAQRGKRVGAPAFDVRGTWRALVAILTLFTANALSPSTGLIAPAVSLGLPGGIRFVAGVTTLALLQFTVEYCQQAGVASLQIGLLRQLGYVIPERFNRPLLASGPIDFWRRWNTYVGGWVQRYVFWPTAFELGRQNRNLSATLCKATAVLVTFGVVGLLHDAYPYFANPYADRRGLLVFLAAGVLVLLWAGIARFSEQVSWTRLHATWIDWATRRLSRPAFWACTLMLFLWWRA